MQLGHIGAFINSMRYKPAEHFCQSLVGAHAVSNLATAAADDLLLLCSYA